MRNRMFGYSCVFICLGFLAVLTSPSVLSQERDVDEQRLEIGKTGVTELEQNIAVTPEEMLVDKEEKYVTGKDKVWFTDDDAIYEYYQIEHDSTGKIFKRACFKAGKDMIPYNYDDQLQNFQLFEYGLDGKLLKEASFDGQNVKQFAKQYDLAYEYNAAGKKIKTVRYDPKHKEIRSMVFSYDASGQLIQDIEYVAKNVEKYHRFEYDAAGRMTRAMEYHSEKDGKGPDGIWFTPDDVVSSTKESFYNADGTKAEDNKYVSSGPDGQWFTKDDQMQYYVLFEYQQ